MRFNTGWVKLHYSIFDHPSVKGDDRGFRLFAWLLSHANWKASRARFNGELIDLLPGQLITASTELSKSLVMPRTTIERKLDWFEKCGSITQKTGNLGRLITIVNWLDYQGQRETDGHQTGNERTSNGHQTDTYTDYKTDKKTEEKTEGESPKAPPPPSALVSLWNEKASPGLPRVGKLTPDSRRYRDARARLKANPDLDYWRQVVERISASSFCCGRNDRSWLADFEFLCRSATHEKVMEGKYDDRRADKPQGEWLDKWLKEEDRK